MYVKINQMTRATADERAMLWGCDNNVDVLLFRIHSCNCPKNIHIHMKNGFEIYTCI